LRCLAVQWDKKNKAFYFWFGTITKDDKGEKCCVEYNIKDPPAFTISATGTCITGDCATYKQLVQDYHAQNKK
jgi:hypothetical protein